ncbi:YjbF family lipoprotein [Pseudooceanicola algae]|uniref:Lipoprotein n=1 Tax=Pseudooceanicola algae TaxID=1537215 RepID=A0A418SDA2_9RHOB|nr:YjbF family lipoprotein [Pseudooceanicola algae]QPM92569.1 hypothetical protein PSAL_038330 [Pseudooceanicola algae]
MRVSLFPARGRGRPVFRGLALVLSSALALAGCGIGEGADTGPGTARDPSFLDAFLPWGPDGAVPTARYAALETAGVPVMQVSDLQSGARYPLRRVARSADGVTAWLAPDGSGFSFRNGILVATRGTGDDLMSADVSGLADLLARGQSGRAERFHSRLDGQNQVVLTSYVCDVSRSPAEGGIIVSEDCAGAEEGLVNTFLLTPSGDMFQSNQLGFQFESMNP